MPGAIELRVLSRVVVFAAAFDPSKEAVEHLADFDGFADERVVRLGLHHLEVTRDEQMILQLV